MLNDKKLEYVQEDIKFFDKVYKRIYSEVTREGEQARYPEAIDDGFGYRPVSGYRFYKHDYPSKHYKAHYESVFNCWDGWDSMMYDDPSWIGQTKREAVLGCYAMMKDEEVRELENKVKDLESKLHEESQISWRRHCRIVELNKQLNQGE